MGVVPPVTSSYAFPPHAQAAGVVAVDEYRQYIAAAWPPSVRNKPPQLHGSRSYFGGADDPVEAVLLAPGVVIGR